MVTLGSRTIVRGFDVKLPLSDHFFALHVKLPFPLIFLRCISAKFSGTESYDVLIICRLSEFLDLIGEQAIVLWVSVKSLSV